MITDCHAPGRFAAVLQPFVDRHELAGAVTLVANADEVLSLETVGFADLATQRPMQPDALFWIASQTKPITATALMMLVDEGLVRLDDLVESYLPEFADQWLIVEEDQQHRLLKRPQHPITIRHILNHTSGMPFDSAIVTPTLDRLSLRDLVYSYVMTPLQSEPGSKYQYSNAGINTAGRIIEVVSGLAYETFLQTRIFEPLGMPDTTFRPNAEQLTRLAKSYKPNADATDLEETSLKYLYGKDQPRQVPAGGLFSTAGDVARFCQMILNNGVYAGTRYISEAAIRQMTRKQTGDHLTEQYGLGWTTDDGNYGHGGAYSTNMTIHVKHGLITVFLVQHAGFPGDGGNCHAAFLQEFERQYGG